VLANGVYLLAYYGSLFYSIGTGRFSALQNSVLFQPWDTWCTAFALN